ncbi:GNAT family N-acetyltransferase [Deinococcus koreensis]|uniref:GNAT family N-acetyltransferase n=1 Tax=Deinococcus koreensis TaxID=2054903 RepID=A0A2K3UXJ2_9DEIO|nr:GNAT family N-acetyltransferase [Deinococcus koreensis]PNY81260.1 GNAT family N-acetyltransferase [Deinococcus koreensis]
MTPLAATLRPVNPDDLPAFHAVMMAAGMDARSNWNRTTLADLERSLLSPGSGGFLAVGAGGEALGCVGYRPDGDETLTLNKLATLPGARGTGLGRALVWQVEHVARTGGFGRVLLAVSQFNLDAVPFYEHLGYEVDPDAVYAHANPASPPPVVLVKAVLPSAALDDAHPHPRPTPTEDAHP